VTGLQSFHLARAYGAGEFVKAFTNEFVTSQCDLKAILAHSATAVYLQITLFLLLLFLDTVCAAHFEYYFFVLNFCVLRVQHLCK